MQVQDSQQDSLVIVAVFHAVADNSWTLLIR